MKTLLLVSLVSLSAACGPATNPVIDSTPMTDAQVGRHDISIELSYDVRGQCAVQHDVLEIYERLQRLIAHLDSLGESLDLYTSLTLLEENRLVQRLCASGGPIPLTWGIHQPKAEELLSRWGK